jgi:hypothetical protein
VTDISAFSWLLNVSWASLILRHQLNNPPTACAEESGLQWRKNLLAMPDQTVWLEDKLRQICHGGQLLEDKSVMATAMIT